MMEEVKAKAREEGKSEEEKEEGELEEGELEDEDGDEEPAANTEPPSHTSPVEKGGDGVEGRRKSGGDNASHETGGNKAHEPQTKDESKRERREVSCAAV